MSGAIERDEMRLIAESLFYIWMHAQLGLLDDIEVAPKAHKRCEKLHPSCGSGFKTTGFKDLSDRVYGITASSENTRLERLEVEKYATLLRLKEKYEHLKVIYARKITDMA